MKARMSVVAVLVLLALLAFAPQASADTPIPSEVKAKAESGLDFFKARVAARPQEFGFDSAAAVARVSLGQGFQLYDVDPTRLQSAQTLASVVTPVSAWQFIVELDGAAKSFITVALERGAYEIVDIGGEAQSLAVALDSFARRSPPSTSEPRLVRGGPVTYVLGVAPDGEFVAPAVAANRTELAGGLDATHTWPAALALRHLQEVQRNARPGQLGGVSAADTSRNAPAPAPSFPWIVVSVLGVAVAGGAAVIAVRKRTSARR